MGGLTLCCDLRLLDLKDLGLVSPEAVSRFVRATAPDLQDIVTSYGRGKGKGENLPQMLGLLLADVEPGPGPG